MKYNFYVDAMSSNSVRHNEDLNSLMRWYDDKSVLSVLYNFFDGKSEEAYIIVRNSRNYPKMFFLWCHDFWWHGYTTAFYLQINLTQVQINLYQIQINLCQIQINLCQIQINLCQIQINLCQIQINLCQIQINLCQIQINLCQIQINSSQIQINSSQIQINSSQIQIN